MAEGASRAKILGNPRRIKTARRRRWTCSTGHRSQRYYDPVTGRFISPDPIGPTPGNIYNFNRYAYANDNPIRYTDPTGMCAKWGNAKAMCKQAAQRRNENQRIIDFGGSVTNFGSGGATAQPIRVAFDGAGSDKVYSNIAFTQFAKLHGFKIYDAKLIVGADQSAAITYILIKLRATPQARIVLMGYSAGGDAAIDIAQILAHKGIKTGVLLTFGAHLAAWPWTHNYTVSNVGAGLNFYQRNPFKLGMNPFHGGTVSCPTCVNINLTGQPVTHVNIVPYALDNYGALINSILTP